MVKKRILITGVSGLVGTVLAASLKKDHEVSGVDLIESKLVPTLKADCSDIEEILPAFSGIDTVIDLASNPSQFSEWDVIHDVNLRCTANALEAAKICGVKRVIFASSNHATGMYETDDPYKKIVNGDYTGRESDSIPLVTTEMPVRPDGPNGIAKAYGEAAGRIYSAQYGIRSSSHSFDTQKINIFEGEDREKINDKLYDLVLEETGWGVVPETKSGNLFRDRMGELSQQLEIISDYLLPTT